MAKKILQSLISIQQTLSAPKDKFNSFGKYSYRSLEGIEEAIKPLLKENNCGIRFNDEVVEHCGRTFLRTTLVFFNIDGEEISVNAEAEHAVQKPGMDQSQITGAASSYARKYAMNALFAIDDSKDADTDEYHCQQQNTQHMQQAVKTRSKKNAPAIPPQAATQSAKPDPIIPQAPTLDILPNDKYATIKGILKNLKTIDEMMELYKQHKDEVESNPEIKDLFGIRKQQIKSQTA